MVVLTLLLHEKNHRKSVQRSKENVEAMAKEKYSESPKRFCWLKWTVGVVACLVCTFIFWPSNPELKIERLIVKRVKVHPLPPIGADVRISVMVKVRNRDIYWMELTDVDVGIKYRGRKLGHVESEGWHVRSWGFSLVDGDLEFSGLPAPEVAHLVEDMAKGRIYFHTVTEVSGQLGFSLFRFPLMFKVILSCEVLVNTKNHSIILQHCIHKD